MATVLIVDDDAALREGIAETLADLGHRSVQAEDGRDYFRAGAPLTVLTIVAGALLL